MGLSRRAGQRLGALALFAFAPIDGLAFGAGHKRIVGRDLQGLGGGKRFVTETLKQREQEILRAQGWPEAYIRAVLSHGPHDHRGPGERDASAEGVFVAGSAIGPETIDDSIAQGKAAAMAALEQRQLATRLVS